MKGAAQNLYCLDIGEVCVRLEHLSKTAQCDSESDLTAVRCTSLLVVILPAHGMRRTPHHLIITITPRRRHHQVTALVEELMEARRRLITYICETEGL